MIAEHEKEIILQCARKYNVSYILLFGSSIEKDDGANDIDLGARGTEIPKSDTWHKDLLNLSVSLGIIPEKLSDDLYEYLTFRHFFVHAYGFMLEEAHLENLANNITNVWLQFLSVINKYCQTSGNAT